jgi:hypothetical protein
MTSTSLRFAFGAAALAMVVLSGQASAAPPPSIVGIWNGVGNQTAVQLRITFQAAAGVCRAVQGTLGPSNVAGFYCPSTGRVSLLRKVPATNDTNQVWTGNVADDAAADRMAGTFVAVAAGGGALGEYPFEFVR